MDRKNRPIGLYDSGLGGISVLKEAIALMPNENYIYYGDSANAPYGIKDEETVRGLSMACGNFLYGKDVKMIIIACNTATSIVVKNMREAYNIPIISMEPAIKPAAEKYMEGDILVLATPATLKQKRYEELVLRLELNNRIINVPCEKLAGLIEKGDVHSNSINDYLAEKFSAYTDNNICAIVLGCTHYTFISKEIEEVAKKVLTGSCEIFNGVQGTVRHAKNILEQLNIRNEKTEDAKIEIYSSGSEKTVDLYKRFLDE